MPDGSPFEIAATTRFCAVLGHPVKHSASPAMHNAAIEASNLDWRYLAFDVLPDELTTTIKGAASMRFIGLNLTVPHKLLALPLMDELDGSAREWGAVNTVVFEGAASDGVFHPIAKLNPEVVEKVRTKGYNTDADAIVRAIQEAFSLSTLKGCSTLILGAGGAARAAALRIARETPDEMFLINRTPSKAEQLAQEIRERNPAVKISVGYPGKSVDILLNATSLGLRTTDELPLDQSQFSLSKACRVYDMIYRPAETRLLARARELGCATSNGLGMLLYQGARAFELWSGKPAPISHMQDALNHAVLGSPQIPRTPGTVSGV